MYRPLEKRVQPSIPTCLCSESRLMIQEAVGARGVEFFEQERAAFFKKKTGTSRESESLWGNRTRGGEVKRVLEFAHDARCGCDCGEYYARSRTDRASRGKSASWGRRNYSDRHFQDFSCRMHSRGACSGFAAFRRKSGAGTRGEVASGGRSSGYMAFHWASAKQ